MWPSLRAQTTQRPQIFLVKIDDFDIAFSNYSLNIKVKCWWCIVVKCINNIFKDIIPFRNWNLKTKPCPTCGEYPKHYFAHDDKHISNKINRIRGRQPVKKNRKYHWKNDADDRANFHPFGNIFFNSTSTQIKKTSTQ